MYTPTSLPLADEMNSSMVTGLKKGELAGTVEPSGRVHVMVGSGLPVDGQERRT